MLKWLILGWWLPLFSFAQKPLYISLEQFTMENTPCRVERVIDVREDKSNIGYTQRGMANVKVPVYFLKSAEEEFQSLFERNYLADYPLHLIIRINYINVYEFTYSTREVAFAELSMTFITREDNAWFEQFQSAVIIENSGVTDATRSHSNNIKQAIEQSFNEFYKRVLKGVIEKKQVSEPQLYLNPLKKANYKIHSAGNIPKAIFKTFYDFRDYSPDTSRAFKIKYKADPSENSERGVPFWVDENQKITDIWGFSDGEKVFMRLNNKFYPLVKEGIDFTIYDFSIEQRDNTGAVVAGLLGGLVGALIYASINQPAGGMMKCKIDFTTGGIIPIDAVVYLCKIKDSKPQMERLRSETAASVMKDFKSGYHEKACD